MTASDPGRALLRHTVATVAYRGRKAIADAPATFSGCRAGASSRTAGQILAHIGDLFDWALALADGQHRWRDTVPRTWEEDATRFFDALRAFDARLAADVGLGCSAEQLFQGPIADALAHIGQIAMLRRVAGAPIRGENYFKADIAAGRVSSSQSAPRVEFD